MLRISLILAILAGAGVIVLTQLKVRDHISGIIAVRNENIDGRKFEKGEKEKALADLSDTKDKLASTSTKLANTEADLAAANTKLVDAEAAKVAITKDLEKARDEKKVAQQELARWEGLQTTPDKVKEVIANLKKSQDTVSVLEEEKKILSRTIKRLEHQIAILIGTNEDYEVLLPPGLKGVVKVVDPKWDFVVLDIGNKQGVLQNGIMLVHRDSKLVGKVKILNVMEDRCIANVMPGWKLTDIQEGDQVLY